MDAVHLILVAAHILGIRIEGGERGQGAYQHAHGMGIVAEAFHELLDVLEDAHVDAQGGKPLGLLLGGGQLAVDDEIGYLREGAVLGQVGDVVAAVAQDSFVAIDERDLALAGRRVHESGIVGHHPEVIGVNLNLAQIHCANGVVRDREGVLLLCPVVEDGDGVLHEYVLPFDW